MAKVTEIIQQLIQEVPELVSQQDQLSAALVKVDNGDGNLDASELKSFLEGDALAGIIGRGTDRLDITEKFFKKQIGAQKKADHLANVAFFNRIAGRINGEIRVDSGRLVGNYVANLSAQVVQDLSQSKDSGVVLSEEQISELEKFLLAVDTNEDGELTLDEINVARFSENWASEGIEVPEFLGYDLASETYREAFFKALDDLVEKSHSRTLVGRLETLTEINKIQEINSHKESALRVLGAIVHPFLRGPDGSLSIDRLKVYMEENPQHGNVKETLMFLVSQDDSFPFFDYYKTDIKKEWNDPLFKWIEYWIGGEKDEQPKLSDLKRCSLRLSLEIAMTHTPRFVQHHMGTAKGRDLLKDTLGALTRGYDKSQEKYNAVRDELRARAADGKPDDPKEIKSLNLKARRYGRQATRYRGAALEIYQYIVKQAKKQAPELVDQFRGEMSLSNIFQLGVDDVEYEKAVEIGEEILDRLDGFYSEYEDRAQSRRKSHESIPQTSGIKVSNRTEILELVKWFEDKDQYLVSIELGTQLGGIILQALDDRDYVGFENNQKVKVARTWIIQKGYELLKKIKETKSDANAEVFLDLQKEIQKFFEEDLVYYSQSGEVSYESEVQDRLYNTDGKSYDLGSDGDLLKHYKELPDHAAKELVGVYQNVLEIGYALREGAKLELTDLQWIQPDESIADAKSFTEFKKSIAHELKKSNRSLWKGYKSHGALSRTGSYVAQVAGMGDKEDIRRAENKIDQDWIPAIAAAKNEEDLVKVIESVMKSLGSGELADAIAAASYDGMEEIINGFQSMFMMITGSGMLILAGRTVMVGLAALTRSSNAAVRLVAGRLIQSQAAIWGNSIAQRGIMGFATGFTVASLENLAAYVSGQAGSENRELESYIKDGIATGMAMAIMSYTPIIRTGRPPFTGEQARRILAGHLRNTLSRYVGQGVKGLGRFGYDGVSEMIEETLDALARQALDGNFDLPTIDELTDIWVVAAASTGSMGAFRALLDSLLSNGQTHNNNEPNDDGSTDEDGGDVESIDEGSTDALAENQDTTEFQGTNQGWSDLTPRERFLRVTIISWVINVRGTEETITYEEALVDLRERVRARLSGDGFVADRTIDLWVLAAAGAMATLFSESEGEVQIHFTFDEILDRIAGFIDEGIMNTLRISELIAAGDNTNNNSNQESEWVLVGEHSNGDRVYERRPRRPQDEGYDFSDDRRTNDGSAHLEAGARAVDPRAALTAAAGTVHEPGSFDEVAGIIEGNPGLIEEIFRGKLTPESYSLRGVIFAVLYGNYERLAELSSHTLVEIAANIDQFGIGLVVNNNAYDSLTILVERAFPENGSAGDQVAQMGVIKLLKSLEGIYNDRHQPAIGKIFEDFVAANPEGSPLNNLFKAMEVLTDQKLDRFEGLAELGFDRSRLQELCLGIVRNSSLGYRVSLGVLKYLLSTLPEGEYLPQELVDEIYNRHMNPDIHGLEKSDIEERLICLDRLTHAFYRHLFHYGDWGKIIKIIRAFPRSPRNFPVITLIFIMIDGEIIPPRSVFDAFLIDAGPHTDIRFAALDLLDLVDYFIREVQRLSAQAETAEQRPNPQFVRDFLEALIGLDGEPRSEMDEDDRTTGRVREEIRDAALEANGDTSHRIFGLFFAQENWREASPELIRWMMGLFHADHFSRRPTDTFNERIAKLLNNESGALGMNVDLEARLAFVDHFVAVHGVERYTEFGPLANDFRGGLEENAELIARYPRVLAGIIENTKFDHTQDNYLAILGILANLPEEHRENPELRTAVNRMMGTAFANQWSRLRNRGSELTREVLVGYIAIIDEALGLGTQAGVETQTDGNAAAARNAREGWSRTNDGNKEAAFGDYFGRRAQEFDVDQLPTRVVEIAVDHTNRGGWSIIPDDERPNDARGRLGLHEPDDDSRTGPVAVDDTNPEADTDPFVDLLLELEANPTMLTTLASDRSLRDRIIRILLDNLERLGEINQSLLRTLFFALRNHEEIAIPLFRLMNKNDLFSRDSLYIIWNLGIARPLGQEIDSGSEPHIRDLTPLQRTIVAWLGTLGNINERVALFAECYFEYRANHPDEDTSDIIPLFERYQTETRPSDRFPADIRRSPAALALAIDRTDFGRNIETYQNFVNILETEVERDQIENHPQLRAAINRMMRTAFDNVSIMNTRALSYQELGLLMWRLEETIGFGNINQDPVGVQRWRELDAEQRRRYLNETLNSNMPFSIDRLPPNFLRTLPTHTQTAGGLVVTDPTQQRSTDARGGLAVAEEASAEAAAAEQALQDRVVVELEAAEAQVDAMEEGVEGAAGADRSQDNQPASRPWWRRVLGSLGRRGSDDE